MTREEISRQSLSASSPFRTVALGHMTEEEANRSPEPFGIEPFSDIETSDEFSSDAKSPEPFGIEPFSDLREMEEELGNVHA